MQSSQQNCDLYKDNDEFNQKYKFIKSKNLNKVDSYVHILSRIRNDKNMAFKITTLSNNTFEQPNFNEINSSNQNTKEQNNILNSDTMSLDYHPLKWNIDKSEGFGTLGTNSFKRQEQLLMRDLLYILSGIEGKYIRVQKTENAVKFILDSSTDINLSGIVNNILVIGEHYSDVVRYIEWSNTNNSLVNQALVAAIRKHHLEYLTMISHLEELLMKNQLFLQQMNYILLPFIHTICFLADITKTIYKNQCYGGPILTVLHEKIMAIKSGPTVVFDLGLLLIRQACVPYFEILKDWLIYGQINDCRNEFFIESNISLHQSYMDDTFLNNEGEEDHFDQRFKIVSDKIPTFIKKYETIIYKTGKYQTFIKQLMANQRKLVTNNDIGNQNNQDNLPIETDLDLSYSLCEATYVTSILSIHEKASSLLLRILLHESSLIETFNAGKHYMLCSKADFINSFICKTKNILKCKQIDLPRYTKKSLETIMLNEIDNSVNSIDRSFWKNENVQIEYVDQTLSNQLELINQSSEFKYLGVEKNSIYCYESFTLKFEVAFPLSQIYTKKSIIYYKLLFRFIFLLRYAQIQLEDEHKSTSMVLKWNPKNDDNINFNALLRKSSILRFKMINLIRNLHHYFMSQVIEIKFEQFLSKVAKCSSSIDAVIEYHEKCLQDCFQDCFLSNKDISSLIINLLDCIQMFHSSEVNNNFNEFEYDFMLKSVEQSWQEFDSLMMQLFKHLNNDSRIECRFVARLLDFNNFYVDLYN